jgi:hypothetical protein
MWKRLFAVGAVILACAACSSGTASTSKEGTTTTTTLTPVAPRPPPRTAPPPPPTTAAATTTAGRNCTPGYDPCISPGSDVDCAGGSGNGPRYVSGPVRVTGPDIYDLDRDGDGVGCE